MLGKPRLKANHRRTAAAATVIGLACGVMMGLASPAAAHVERPSYWPDPKADCSITPCAGGKVPSIRSLASALDAAPPGNTRVVCKSNSLTLLKSSIASARKVGFNIRPTDHRTFSANQAKYLLTVNTRLFARCKYREIQPAVTASRNNDRVVIMPGLYTEPTSRSKPSFDPACDPYEMEAESGDPGALTHEYQIRCPNDANLVAVIGRGSDTGAVPAPRDDRHGIPNVGRCIRCNVQVEGSGVKPSDVIVEAGSAAAGSGGPSAVGHKKDVGIFVDRADGFVLRNVEVRHAREHTIYVLETDGYKLDRFHGFYAGGYGVLTFVGDHGVIQNCDTHGNGDSGVYPGSGADSTDDRYLPFYPEPRYSQVVRYCDSHHNTSGFSGTNSHGTLITNNNFFGNALGYTTDVFTAPGHPGFPQHGNLVQNNNFYSNNFNPFKAGSDVDPFIPAPVGTGLWLAGGNGNHVRNNRFYDNWRRGTMLFAVPDALVCGPEPVGSNTPVPGCNPLGISTSFRNRQYDNVMGVDPKGKVKPNGLDFWWDSFLGNSANCWWGNKAAPGKSVTMSPANLPNCANGTNPSSSIGLGLAPLNEAELVACFAGFTLSGYPDGDDTTCSWAVTPSPPGARTAAGTASSGAVSSGDPQAQGQVFAAICEQGLATRLCTPYAKYLEEQEPVEAEASMPGVEPKESDGPLSSFTCSWWREADDAHRLGMIDRIAAFSTGRVDDGHKAVGYGAALSDEQAYQLFEGRCTTFHAGAFALYKLYGAAAPFAAAKSTPAE